MKTACWRTSLRIPPAPVLGSQGVSMAVRAKYAEMGREIPIAHAGCWLRHSFSRARLLPVLVFLVHGVAWGKQVPCAPGVFSLERGIVTASGVPAIGSIAVEEGAAELMGVCPAIPAKVARNRGRPAGTKVIASSSTCGPLKRVKVRAVIRKRTKGAPECSVLIGTIRIARSPALKFLARRVTHVDPPVDPPPEETLDYFTLPASAPPLAIATLGRSSIPASSEARVRFFNTDGYSTTVSAITSNPVRVVIPIYTDPTTMALTAGVVSAEVVFPNGSTKPVTGTLIIAAPPEVTLPPGRLTLAFLKGLLNANAAAQASMVELRGGAIVIGSRPIEEYLYDSANRLRDLVRDLDGYVNYGAAPIQIGALRTPDGLGPLVLDQQSLAVSDRIVAALLAQLDRSGDVRNAGSLRLDSGQEDAAENDLADRLRGGAQDALDVGAKISSTLGKAVSVAGGLALLAGASIPGASLAVAGAFIYVASTWPPGAISAVLTVGTRAMQDVDVRPADLVPTIKYVVGNTIQEQLKFLIGTTIERDAGEPAAGMFTLVDETFDFTKSVADGLVQTTEAVVNENPVGSAPTGRRGCRPEETPVFIDFRAGTAYCPEHPYVGTWTGTYSGTLGSLPGTITITPVGLVTWDIPSTTARAGTVLEGMISIDGQLTVDQVGNTGYSTSFVVQLYGEGLEAHFEGTGTLRDPHGSFPVSVSATRRSYSYE